MSVRHSTEDLSNILQQQDPFCGCCHQPMQPNNLIATSPCQHRFHHECIQRALQHTNICPTCKNPCRARQLSLSNNNLAAELNAAGNATDPILPAPDQNTDQNSNRRNNRYRRGGTTRRGMTTRSAQRAMQNDEANQSSLTVDSSKEGNREDIDKIVQSAMQQQEQHLMRNLSALIQSQFANIQINNGSQQETNSNVRAGQTDQPPASQTTGSSPTLPRRYSSIPPEKVSNIILNWRLKFDGSRQGISTEDFLYRVRSMTRQNLYGDHNLLCDHLHLLLGDKASDWFWKFHRNNPCFTWEKFCEEFRKKYEDADTDMDIWDSINARKQNDKEPFEEFQFEIEKLVSRLRNPITEESLVRILIRNSKMSLRYELMHLGITTLVRLREEIRTHEQFCKQTRQQSYRQPRPFVSELDEQTEIAAIQRKSMKCWNCGKVGHRYDYCLEPRSIFCYGCGAANVFKPNCIHCNNPENSSVDAQARSVLSHPRQ